MQFIGTVDRIHKQPLAEAGGAMLAETENF